MAAGRGRLLADRVIDQHQARQPAVASNMDRGEYVQHAQRPADHAPQIGFPGGRLAQPHRDHGAPVRSHRQERRNRPARAGRTQRRDSGAKMPGSAASRSRQAWSSLERIPAYVRQTALPPGSAAAHRRWTGRNGRSRHSAGTAPNTASANGPSNKLATRNSRRIPVRRPARMHWSTRKSQ